MINSEVQLNVPADIISNWQEIVTLLAEIIGTPTALVMRYVEPYIEVCVASKTQGNPYHPGEKDKLYGSGLYCETVLKTQNKLLVPNALEDEKWKHNPDIKYNMISYLGFPIMLPNQKPFGTICILDNKPNSYSLNIEKLMLKFRSLIESHLELIYMNTILGDKNQRLSDYLMEIQALRGFVQICANCKSIRDEQGNWHRIEHYLIRHPTAQFSHSLCPQCMKHLYPEFVPKS